MLREVFFSAGIWEVSLFVFILALIRLGHTHIFLDFQLS